MRTLSIKLSLNIFAIFLAFASIDNVFSQSTTTTTVKRVDQPFEIEGTVIEAADVSAIARAPNGLGVLVSDEGASVQILSFDAAHRAKIIAKVPLGGSEADFEGAAFDTKSGEFFVTGSHGVSKKKGKFQRSRFTVQRLLLHPDTPSRPKYQATANLTEILLSDAVLGEFFGKPLQQKGVNIEGLAARDGMLFFGLRSPNLDGNALVLEIDADDIFKDPESKYLLHRIPVGKGVGIRALSAVEGGFLLLTGNAGSERTEMFPETVDYIDGRGSNVFFWKPGSTNQIANLPKLKGKAEGMLVLNETEAHYDVVVVYDSADGGAPARFEIAKPR